MNTQTLPRPRRQNLRVLPIPFLPTVAGYGLPWPSERPEEATEGTGEDALLAYCRQECDRLQLPSSPQEAPAAPLDTHDITNALLLDCLNQFDALGNACTFTRSLELRNRLRAALNLPLEVAEEFPEAPLCAGCGAYVESCTCGLYPPDGWHKDASPLPICPTPEATPAATLPAVDALAASAVSAPSSKKAKG